MSESTHLNPGKAPGNTILERLIESIWTELSGTLGSAPTAVLLRRAIVISKDSCPALADIVIEKSGRDYQYKLPQDSIEASQICSDLSIFVNNILSLLSGLMGNVLVNRLLSNPLIRELSDKE